MRSKLGVRWLPSGAVTSIGLDLPGCRAGRPTRAVRAEPSTRASASTACCTGGDSAAPRVKSAPSTAYDVQARREAAERARELDRVRDAEGVGGGAQPARVQRLAVGAERVQGARAARPSRRRRRARRAGGPPTHRRGTRRPRRPRAPRRRRARGTPCARARRPAASSPRQALPTPTTRVSTARSRAAGSASRRRCRGRSCGSPARSGAAARVVERQVTLRRRPRRLCSIARLVLRGRRHDPRVEDRAVGVDARSGARAARAAPRSSRSRSPPAAPRSTAGGSGGS